MTKKLRNIFTDPAEVEGLTREALIKGIQSQFPVESRDYRLEVSDVTIDNTPISKLEEKDAILKSKSLTRLVKGTVTLHDKKTNRIVDTERDFALADFYSMTDKHTMIYKGNNYSMANLIQLMPGVYTRSKKDGELEAQINTQTGRSLSIQLDPEKGKFTMMAAGSKSRIPVAPILQEVFGVSEREARRYVPGDVWASNLDSVSQVKKEAAVESLYSRVVSKPDQNRNASYEDQKLAIRQALESSGLSAITTEATLGKAKTGVDKEVLLQSMKNIVDVHRGVRDEDNRDSLEFKRVQSLPDFIRDRFAKEDDSVKKAKRRLGFRMEKIDRDDPKIRGAIGAKPFKDVFTNVIVRSNLSTTPTETNPIESLENVGKVTAIAAGEGGMSDSRMADFNTKNIHASQLGIIDPSRTPESSNAGLDQRFTISAQRDEDGLLYAQVINAATGKQESLSVQEMMRTSVGFPHQSKGTKVYAQVNGKVKEVNRSEVKYWIPDANDMYTVTTNLVPFLNSNHPGRLTMAGKAITQALSLEERDAPLVQTMSASGNSLVGDLGKVISTLSNHDGTVEKVTNDRITIKDSKGAMHNVDLIKDMPFNMKGFHDDTSVVKEGQKIRVGDVLADNTYTKNGQLALGKNLQAAYLAYKGYNHEDGIVVSRSAAVKLRSNHAYKYDYALKRNTETNLALFKRYYSQEFNPSQLGKLDSRGFVKKGTRVLYGDPIYALLEPNEPSAEDKALGRLHKSLVNPYRKIVEVWQHEEPGMIIETHTDTKDVRILARSVKALEVGDKLTGLHGNKGVVSLILDDAEMPQVEGGGKQLDMILNPASVTSRVNLGQIMETAAGKIAEKTGKPYLVKNFEGENTLKTIKDELAKHGLKDTELLSDPTTGKVMGEVLMGPQYILKLNKTTDQNYSARNVGKYDQYLQPIKGGSEGSKSIGLMEFLGLLGSDARANLREIGTVKSEKNEEYWHKFMSGQPLPKPNTTFATKRLFDQMRGAGVQVKMDNDTIQAAPMTDADILGRSHGRIKNALLLSSKNAAPEKGGLFDMGITGGLSGDRWSHYSLSESVVNPTFEKPVMNLLGMTKGDYAKLISGEAKAVKREDGIFDIFDNTLGKITSTINTRSDMEKQASSIEELTIALADEEGLVGGNAFREILGSIDVDALLERDRRLFRETNAMGKKDKIVKRMKYLQGLKENGFDNAASAFMLNNVPVLPPVMRPVVDQGGNRMEYADVNTLYKESILANEALAKNKDMLTDDMLVEQRRNHYNSVKAVMGMGESINYKSKKAGITGLMTNIGGKDSPKKGMFLDKIMKKKQDFSGRGTIYADPTLEFNEAAIPRDQLWTMYKMHIIRKLGQQGFTPVEAKGAYDKNELAAINAFNQLIKEVPVILHRAPTLMRTNIMAVKPVPTDGKTIGMNILHLPGYAADFDGDAMSLFLPMTPEAVKEANDKLLPMKHLSDARKGFGVPMFAPGHEAILGSVHLTEADMGKAVVKFKTEKEALTALRNGDIEDNTPIEITG